MTAAAARALLLVGLTRAGAAPLYQSVESVDPVDDLAPGLYVGQDALIALEIDPGSTPGAILDGDGYYVWQVTALPGFVSVTVLDVEKLVDGANAGIVTTEDVDGLDITAWLDDDGNVAVVTGNAVVQLPQPEWRAFVAAVGRLID